MLEPCLIWQENYHQNKQLPKPHSIIRLLSLCRIRPAPQHLDRTRYPLARSSHSLVLQTADEHDYLLEATSVAERDQVLERWKHAVARFAMLAVFLPTPAGNTIVPNYDEEEEDDDDDEDENYYYV